MAEKSEKTKAALCGVAAGAVNGLLGSGGGIVLVPLFISWLHLPAKKAFATSVSVTLALSTCSAAVCFFKGDVPGAWQILPYLAGGAVGGAAAGKLLKDLPVIWLRRLFGALLIVGGIKTLL